MPPSPPGCGDPHRHARHRVAQLRSALAARTHWVLATDLDRRHPTARAIRGLAALATALGAAPGEVLLAEPDVYVRDRRRSFPLTVAAVAKALFSPEDVAELAAEIGGGDRREALAGVRRGADIVPIAADPANLAACLEQIYRGTAAVTAPDLN